jgi:hypothetical protein
MFEILDEENEIRRERRGAKEIRSRGVRIDTSDSWIQLAYNTFPRVNHVAPSRDASLGIGLAKQTRVITFRAPIAG